MQVRKTEYDVKLHQKLFDGEAARCLQRMEILEFLIPHGNTANLLEFNWSSWKFSTDAMTTRWLYCVECPQYSTRRRSVSNIHRSGMLRKNR